MRKMKGIADLNYGGDLDRHCLTIFEKLTPVEKEVFIECFLLVYMFIDGSERIEATMPNGNAEYSESSKDTLAMMDEMDKNAKTLITKARMQVITEVGITAVRVLGVVVAISVVASMFGYEINVPGAVSKIWYWLTLMINGAK